MFGYVVPAWEGLSEAERERYHEAYCGLCRTIGERCGQRCRCALAYDPVFLALLLGSLYELRNARAQGAACRIRRSRTGSWRTACVDYAADATVALAYHKALDDWRDDRSVRGACVRVRAGRTVPRRPRAEPAYVRGRGGGHGRHRRHRGGGACGRCGRGS